ncbi:lipoprotein insertase outer membrane protein LolB [Pseudothauera rhizosphaerae]|uniref:Outer-membrane lipoprotein LolB n=1 Tax=Pseudothauera rhizosphaerae TaxID=2565932 RepID=A0A4S4ANJ9_9RHOO|nr:lipoprotein insertase outer membrane protein LolB [Pseudothauera rhizosphaerae]THF61227.1 outer membrane lipoprotein LolB [Pseudothauera rhizosphaerae]
MPHPCTRRHAPAALLAASLLAAGCATPLAIHTPAAERPLAAGFTLEGRLSASDGASAASGRLEWQHQADGDRWTVLSPLGQIVAQLERDRHGALLRTADGRRYAAANADELLPQVLGVDAPVALLPAWVQAAPGPHGEVRARDARGRPALVVDTGWRIEYPEYAADDPAAPPRRIDLSRGDARLRLIIDHWTPAP